MSPFLSAAIGVAIGYFFKRIVLWIVTGILSLSASYLLVVTWNKEIAALIGLIAVSAAFWVIVPMWITHVVKNIRRQGDNGWWKKLKEKVLD